MQARQTRRHTTVLFTEYNTLTQARYGCNIRLYVMYNTRNDTNNNQYPLFGVPLGFWVIRVVTPTPSDKSKCILHIFKRFQYNFWVLDCRGKGHLHIERGTGDRMEVTNFQIKHDVFIIPYINKNNNFNLTINKLTSLWLDHAESVSDKYIRCQILTIK